MPDLFSDFGEKQTAADRAAFLRAEILRHNDLYHRRAEQEISDAEYDALFAELKALEEKHPELATADSPTQLVGAAPLEGFAQVEHAAPMLSLDNSYNTADLLEFDARVRKALPSGANVQYVAELKIDGVSVSLTYRNRALVRAATRGNGRVGDDITANALTIKTLPRRLLADAPAGEIEVRGEIYISRDGFEAVNNERREADEQLFANPRNAAAGSLKLLDSKTAAKRPLDLFAYWLRDESSTPAPHIETLSLLSDLGFKVEPNRAAFSSIGELIQHLGRWETERHSLPYETDGVVIKVNDPAQQAALGATSHHPRYAIAFKYPPEQKPTKILAISIQVGRTGALTPVAELEPVPLSGTVVSRATLHNEDEIRRKDIRSGDTVIVQKAGEIIPQVISVVMEKRPPDSRPFEFPTSCPVCGGPISKPEGEAVARCDNDWCRAKLKEKVRHFASRQAMDIENLGPAIVNRLIDLEMLSDSADIFYLENKREELTQLEGMGEKSVANLLAAIEKRKNPESADRLIFALGIRHVGQRSAQILAEQFDSLDAIAAATTEQLIDIPEIGPAAAEAISAFFSREHTRDVLEKLRSAGVALRWEKPAASGPGPLTGKTFVITGALSRPRDEIKRRIEASGGRVSSAISKKTGYLLCGEDAGSKLEKAQKLGVAVIDETTLEDMLK